MSYYYYRVHPRYETERYYEQDRDRDPPRSQIYESYRPSEESRDARRDDRRPSRDDTRDRRTRNPPPPYGRADSSLQTTASGQASSSIGSLVSSPREPVERTPANQSNIANRTDKASNTPNIPNGEIYKHFLEAFSGLVTESNKRQKASRDIRKCEQQQKELPKAAVGSKIWQDTQRKSKADHDIAQAKQQEAEKRSIQSLQKLIQCHMDQRDKTTSPATSSLGQEQEASLVKKIQGILKEQVKTSTSEQDKAMKELLEKALADKAATDDQWQKQISEHIQKVEGDIRIKLQQELNDEYAVKTHSLQQAFANKLDDLKKDMHHELNVFKQHCDGKISALEVQNRELDGKVSALEVQNQELLSDQEKIKKQSSEEMIDYAKRLDSQYKDELATVKEQVATVTANLAATAAIPAPEIQSLRETLDSVVTDLSVLSNAVNTIEQQDKADVIQSGQNINQQQQQAVTAKINERLDELEKETRTLEKDLRRVLLKQLDTSSDRVERLSQSAEPRSSIDSPAVNRHVQVQSQGGVTQKAFEKGMKKTRLFVQSWALQLFEQYDSVQNSLGQNIQNLKNALDAISTQVAATKVDNLESKVDAISTRIDAASDALEGHKAEALERTKAFDQRISHLYENQNSWRSTEFANWMIKQIQVSTPQMLGYSLQQVSGRLVHVEQRQDALEKRLDADPNKRRKVTNGHTAANDQQASPNTNYLIGLPSQNAGQPPSGHRSPPVNNHQPGQQLDGQQLNIQQHGQQFYGHLQSPPPHTQQQ